MPEEKKKKRRYKRNRVPRTEQLKEENATTSHARLDAGIKISLEKILGFLPDLVRKNVENCVDQDPEWFELDEMDFLKKAKKIGFIPSPAENRVRMNLWMQLDRKFDPFKNDTDRIKDTPIAVERLYHGVVSRGYLYDRLLCIPHRAAWLLCRPMSYTGKIEEALYFAVDEMRKVLAMDNYDNDGKVNAPVINAKIRIWERLENRVLDGGHQKITIGSQGGPKTDRGLTYEEQMRMLDEQEASIMAKLEAPKGKKDETIEVKAIDIETDAGTAS